MEYSFKIAGVKGTSIARPINILAGAENSFGFVLEFFEILLICFSSKNTSLKAKEVEDANIKNK